MSSWSILDRLCFFPLQSARGSNHCLSSEEIHTVQAGWPERILLQTVLRSFTNTYTFPEILQENVIV